MADVYSIVREQTRELESIKRAAFDGGGGGGYDGGMEARVTKLEADLAAIKVDLAVIKANGATKSDIADLRAATKVDIADLGKAIAESQTKIIGWVVMAIFLAQLLPMLKDFVRPALAPQVPAATAAPPAK